MSAPVLVADTIDYLTARFVFMTGDWDGLEVWAHFRQGDTAYDFRLDEDGEITADQHLNLTEGVWSVYLTGHLYSGGAMLQRISTQVAEVEVVKSGIVNANPFPPIPATVEEQIFAELADHEERLSDVEQNGTGGGTGDITGAVRYDVLQELTDEQKMQARSNTGAASKTDVDKQLGEVSGAIGKLPQPDWNQNDSTAKDYVKNRPFWMDDPVEKTVIHEMTDVWEKNQTFLELIEIIPGAVYKIYWDGTLYECTAYLIDTIGYVIGNGTLILGSEFSGGNGEPFLIGTLEGKITFVIAEQDGEHTIKIDAVIAEVHKIDRSFLPSATYAEPGIISTQGIQYSVIDIGKSYYIGSGQYELVTYSEFSKYLSSKALPTLNVHVKKKSSDSYFHVMFVVTDVSHSVGGIDGTTSINVRGFDYINNNITGLEFAFPEDNADTHEVAADATLLRIDYHVRDDFLIKNNGQCIL